jgi:hypothetical protein
MNQLHQLEMAEESYRDSMGSVTVAGITFDGWRVLQELDPIAYDCGLADYLDSLGIDTDI